MAVKIEYFLGELFSAKCDLIVLPCSRSGSITGWVKHRIQELGIPGPSGYKGLGATEFHVLKNSTIASFACWATSVAKNRSSPEALRQIGRSIAEYTSTMSNINMIALPLLGTGAGGLDELVSARAIIEGFKEVPEIHATLRIHVLNPGVFSELQKEEMRNPMDTVFISYGGPDQEFASRINYALKSRGVSTWFFPEDAVPGAKLHRVMFEGVSKFDRVLLICSQHSLTRNGVVNEIERVLEREATEGGEDILLPIRIDDFVLSLWSPNRNDIKSQVTSRVIADFSVAKTDENAFQEQIEKLIKALEKTKK